MKLKFSRGFWSQTSFDTTPGIPLTFNCATGRAGGWKTVTQNMRELLKHGSYAESRESALSLSRQR